MFGLHAVQSALKRDDGTVQELWVDTTRRDGRMRDLMHNASQAQLRIHRVDRATIESLLPGENAQGVVARCAARKTLGEDALRDLLATSPAKPFFLLVLDGVQDPHNLGACLRSADGAGVDAVIVPRARAAGLTPAVCRVACGAAETVPLIQVGNLARVLRTLRDAGIWLTGLDGDAQQDLYATDLTVPTALVLGAEGKGLRRLTREHCDTLVRIPMAGSVESLNVSVATGICLFEVVRQRTPDPAATG